MKDWEFRAYVSSLVDVCFSTDLIEDDMNYVITDGHMKKPEILEKLDRLEYVKDSTWIKERPGVSIHSIQKRWRSKDQVF